MRVVVRKSIGDNGGQRHAGGEPTLLYALVVGIDAYPAPVPPLRGARNDADHVAAHLTDRFGADHLALQVLRDADATRAAVVAGFRAHLARARAGDTALFWFSGHGSEVPADPAALPYEGTGTSQTLVCVDSRTAAGADLLDVELAALVDVVAAGGAHVTLVLDCCHADGATRDVDQATVRAAPAPATRPPAERLLPELATTARGVQLPDDLPAVVLAACGVRERARERRLAGTVQGVFTFGLLEQLHRPDAWPTYRELLTAARATVEDRSRDQRPTLRPGGSSRIDQPFLGGHPTGSRPAAVLRYVRRTWQIDVGQCHGVTAGTEDDPTTFAVAGQWPVRAVRVAEALTAHCVVTPVDWTPERDTRYPMVLTRSPASATVSIGGADPATVALLAAHVARSPHLRRITDGPADIVVTCPGDGTVQAHGPNATGARPDLVHTDVTTAEAALAVVGDLAHMARWLRVRTLRNPVSALTGAVHLDVLPAGGRAPDDRDGVLHLCYRWDGRAWRPPDVFLRLRNTSDRPLCCAVLDLTDRYRVDPAPCRGDWVDPGRTLHLSRAPMEFRLPDGVPPRPGASVRDWLLVLAAEQAIDTEPLALNELGTPGVRPRAQSQTEPPGEWTTFVVPVVTGVPDRGVGG